MMLDACRDLVLEIFLAHLGAAELDRHVSAHRQARSAAERTGGGSGHGWRIHTVLSETDIKAYSQFSGAWLCLIRRFPETNRSTRSHRIGNSSK